MPDAVSALERALAGLVDAVAGVAVGWLVLGVALHLAHPGGRGRGWFAVVRSACDATPPRGRDAIAAWVAGAGAGGVVSARGGDVVRVLVLGRRMAGERAVLAGTLVAESVGECTLGLLTLGLAVVIGVDAGLNPKLALYALAALPVLALATRHPRSRALLARMRCGCAALKCPRAYAREVLPWQLLSRLLRLAALGCFLAAFHLPATLAAVLLVTFAQCGGRLVPFSPASGGARTAVLAACLGPGPRARGPPPPPAPVFVGTSTVLTVVGTALALVLCATQAKAGSTREGRLTRIRAAIAARP